MLANDTTGDAVDPTSVQIVGTTNPGDDLVVVGEGIWSVDPASGAITFTPEPGFTADPTDIAYTVDDAEGNTSNAAVVSVDYDQLPPVAVDDSSLANPAGPVTLNAVDGTASVGGVADSDPNGDLDPATVSLSGGSDTDGDGDLDELVVAGEGTWSVDELGNVTFTPEVGFTADPTPVTYRVSDATNLLSNLATVTIDFVPVATDDSSLGNVTNTPVTVDVLANDTTGDAVDPTSVQIVGTTNPGDDLVVVGEGTWSVDPVSGAITFTPEPGFTDDPTDITYTVDDVEGNTSNAAVVAVGYDQQPPVAVDDESLANPAGPVTLNVLDGSSSGGVADTDADGDLDPVTVDLDPATPGVQATLTVVGEGEFTVDATGNVTFTPEAGFTNDPTPIPYTVSDTTGLVSNTATITIDYVPVATDDSSTGNTTGTPVTVDVLANDTTGDIVDATSVQIVGTTNPGDDLIVAGEGIWSVDPASGAITFTPEPGFTADPTDITYTVDDAEGNTSNAAVVSVDYVQLPPVAVDDASLANPAGPVTLNALDGSCVGVAQRTRDPNGDLDPASVDLDPATPGVQATLTVAGEGEFTVDATGM